MNVHRFLIVIEDAGENDSAYSPDLSGCVAAGATMEETERNMDEAIQMHLDALREDGLPIPESSPRAKYVVMGGLKGRRQKAEGRSALLASTFCLLTSAF